MNKTALYAVMLAILLPLTAYFIVKKKSETVISMPRHYLPDTVITVTKKGKQTDDTVWHQVKDFNLVNQEGMAVTYDSLKGKIIVADFFFTHCPSICPPMTKNMKRLAESLNNGERVGDRTNRRIHFLSFSVDPERDSVEQLKRWADRFQVNPETWWLLTGDKKTIYDLGIEEMKLGIMDGHGIDTSFMHSELFVLIDSNRYVRGYYDGLDSTSLARLSKDLILLTKEKDPHGKSFLAGKLQLIAVVFLITILALAIFFHFFRNKK